MAHYTSDVMTGGPVPSHHVGLNTQICTVVIPVSGSSSLTMALTPLPAGSRVVGVKHVMSNDGYGTGGEFVSIFANIGGLTTVLSAQYQYIRSATMISAANPVVRENRMQDLGKRITASANLFASYTNFIEGAGTASVSVTVIVQYLRDKRGD